MKDKKRRILRNPFEKRRDERPGVLELFASLKEQLPALEKLYERWGGGEDTVYRFYHQSFKVYRHQEGTLAIVEALKALRPGASLNEWFLRIVQDGTGKVFSPEDNENWLVVTRPIIEAFLHANYFLEMAVRYGRELEYPIVPLPSGWAALLELYDLR